jgi:hypothetical protein
MYPKSFGFSEGLNPTRPWPTQDGEPERCILALLDPNPDQGWLIDQRGQMQDKLAATVATSFGE